MSPFLNLLIGWWIPGCLILYYTSAQVIEVLPSNQTVKEGRDANINCTYSASNGTDINGIKYSWRGLNGTGVLSNTSQLTLKNINRTDAGIYSCIVTNVSANWNSTSQAQVLVSYPPTILSSAINHTVNESSRTTLRCKADGYPPPKIRWSRPSGSQVSLSNNHPMVLLNTSRSQHGRYSCQAHNDEGYSATKVGYLNVQYKPHINTTHLNEKLNSWVHHNSTLTCEAEGNPSPTVTWSHNNMVSRSHTGTSGSASIFVLPKGEADFGSYICKAWNKLGTVEFNVEVVRSAFPPEQPNILNNETKLTSRVFQLKWDKPNANGRQIDHYIVWHHELNSALNSSEVKWKGVTVKTQSFNVNSSLWGTSYEIEIAVTAVNDQGESSRDKTKKFAAVPRVATTPTFPTTRSNGNLHRWVAIASGVAFVVVIILLICFCNRRRRRGPRAQPMQPFFPLNDRNSNSKQSAPRLPNSNTYNEVPEPKSRNTAKHMYTNMTALDEMNPDWEYPRGKVHIEKYVGKGAFCVVAKALVDDLGIVAVKIPKVKSTESDKKDLLAEYELMKQLQHPNVIRLVGAVTQSDPVMVIFEYVPYGDLLGFLKRSRGLEDQYYNDPDIKPTSSLSSEQLLKFAQEIADGMAYLGTHKIIHRDLAARNVLVGEEETCKITDFGMARDVQQDDIYFKRTRGRLPVKWTAIESLLYGICTTQSDVWSYGVVLYEIFTIGGKPYPDIKGHSLPYMLKDGYRMPKPSHLDDEIYALMSECWEKEANDRPTFEFLSSTIGRLQRCHKDLIYMNVYDEKLYGNVEDLD